MKAPDFWHTRSVLSWPLLPVAALYGIIERTRRRRPPRWEAPIPVICVGNLVVGGAGKTPVALAIGDKVAAAGVPYAFISRGYGGRLKGPLQVDLRHHSAADVGDEPLLLAAKAPTYVARDRVAGAQAALANGARLVILDDGLQNTSLTQDLRLLVVDGSYGFGNGQLLPAGPLRQPVVEGLRGAHGAVVLGSDGARVVGQIWQHCGEAVPVVRANLEFGPEIAQIQGRTVVAFAGIGRPEKFFQALRDQDCQLVARHSFADHHPYRPAEIESLLAEAARHNAVTVTTSKDWVRLPEALRDHVIALPVTLNWRYEGALNRLLSPILKAAW